MANKVYEWKFMTLSADPQKVGEELEALGDTLEPSVVVETARDPSKELHKCFEWDDGEAANRYRYSQAEFLLRNISVRVQVKESEQREIVVRAFEHVNLPVGGQDKPSSVSAYIRIEKVMADDALREQVFERLKASIRQARKTAKNYQTLFPLLVEVGRKLADTEKVLTK